MDTLGYTPASDSAWLRELAAKIDLRGNALLWMDERVAHMALYDRKHGTESTQTVAAYIECGFSAARAAEVLYLHRNSVVYRLHRIERQFGIDLLSDEGEPDMLRVLLSCKACLLGIV